MAESGRHFNRLFTACKGLRRGLVAARKGLVSQYRYKYINQYKFKDQVPRNINKKKLRLRRRSRPLSTRTLMRTWKSSRRASRRTGSRSASPKTTLLKPRKAGARRCTSPTTAAPFARPWTPHCFGRDYDAVRRPRDGAAPFALVGVAEVVAGPRRAGVR